MPIFGIFFFAKKLKFLANFLTFKWQFSGGSASDIICQTKPEHQCDDQRDRGTDLQIQGDGFSQNTPRCIPHQAEKQGRLSEENSLCQPK